MSNVRAKFKVDAITRTMSSKAVMGPDGKSTYEPCEIRTVVMSPVYSQDPESENRKFWDSSPSGKLELGCANLAAAEMFELGREYYIDFSQAN